MTHLKKNLLSNLHPYLWQLLIGKRELHNIKKTNKLKSNSKVFMKANREIQNIKNS